MGDKASDHTAFACSEKLSISRPVSTSHSFTRRSPGPGGGVPAVRRQGDPVDVLGMARNDRTTALSRRFQTVTVPVLSPVSPTDPSALTANRHDSSWPGSSPCGSPSWRPTIRIRPSHPMR